MAEPPSEPFAAAVTRLADQRGWSVERVGLEAYVPGERGVSPSMFRKAFNGKRELTPWLMEAVADALNVSPETFSEYRLARARGLFDERELGLPAAEENYEKLMRAIDGQSAAARAMKQAMEEAAQRARRASAGEASPPP